VAAAEGQREQTESAPPAPPPDGRPPLTVA
jgi:hypothetical protein